MSSKIDTTATFRDRQESRSEKTTSNAQYVKELRSSNTLNPPKKLFKEDGAYIRRSSNPSKNEYKEKTSLQNQELTILKEKFKENVSGKQTAKSKEIKDNLTSQITSKISIGVESIHSLLENSKLDDLGPQVKLYDTMERYELAQSKYLEIKDHLPEELKSDLESRLDKMRKVLIELKQKVTGSGMAGIVLRPEESDEDNPDGSVLGNIADKISTLTDLGLPFVPLKNKDKSEDEPS